MPQPQTEAEVRVAAAVDDGFFRPFHLPRHYLQLPAVEEAVEEAVAVGWEWQSFLSSDYLRISLDSRSRRLRQCHLVEVEAMVVAEVENWKRLPLSLLPTSAANFQHDTKAVAKSHTERLARRLPTDLASFQVIYPCKTVIPSSPAPPPPRHRSFVRFFFYLFP